MRRKLRRQRVDTRVDVLRGGLVGIRKFFDSHKFVVEVDDVVLVRGVSTGDGDGRITSLAVALPDGVDRVGVDDSIAVENDDRAPDLRFGLEEGMAGPELRLLGDVRDGERPLPTVLK